MKKNLTPIESIATLITTQPEAEQFMNQLDMCVDAMYRTTSGLDKKMSEIFGVAKKEAIEALLKSKNLTAKDRVGIQKALTDIKEYMKQMPHVRITLSSEPNTKLLKKISLWLFYNLSQPILIDMVIDKKIIAGMIIEYQGKHLDYSLRKILDSGWSTLESEALRALTN